MFILINYDDYSYIYFVYLKICLLMLFVINFVFDIPFKVKDNNNLKFETDGRQILG